MSCIRSLRVAAATGIGLHTLFRQNDGKTNSPFAFPSQFGRPSFVGTGAPSDVARPDSRATLNRKRHRPAVMCDDAANPADEESLVRTLYPPIEPYKTSFMRTRDGLHELYVEECGNPDGKPALFLHGGPAAGINPANRRLFDPSVYRIILLDQRGAGQSKPNASLEANTTWHLVDDLEQLRDHVGVERWHVIYGGSWGSTLALAYAQKHATRVGSMVLRGIFLFDHEDMAWLFEQGGASEFFPDKFERYKSIITQGERGSLINAYYRHLTSPNEKERLQAAAHFVEWELSISKIKALSDQEVNEELKKPSFILPFARAETHYFVHGGWFERRRQLLDDCKTIEHIPSVIVHGRYDMVCRPRMAWELHKRLPLSTLHFTDTSGHSGMEPNTVDATIRALDRFGELPSPS